MLKTTEALMRRSVLSKTDLVDDLQPKVRDEPNTQKGIQSAFRRRCEIEQSNWVYSCAHCSQRGDLEWGDAQCILACHGGYGPTCQTLFRTHSLTMLRFGPRFLWLRAVERTLCMSTLSYCARLCVAILPDDDVSTAHELYESTFISFEARPQRGYHSSRYQTCQFPTSTGH